MPSITPDEAREALADIDLVTRQMKRTVGASQLGSNLILWGLIWIVGFLCSYLFLARADMIWFVLALLGMGCTLAMGIAESRHPVVKSEQARKLGMQMVLFWIAVITYAMVLGFTMPKGSGINRLVLIVSITMLGYVVMGIWLRSPILSLIGIGVTVATLAGKYWIPSREFMLWMAIFGGGGLFVPGLYVRLYWK